MKNQRLSSEDFDQTHNCARPQTCTTVQMEPGSVEPSAATLRPFILRHCRAFFSPIGGYCITTACRTTRRGGGVLSSKTAALSIATLASCSTETRFFWFPRWAGGPCEKTLQGAFWFFLTEPGKSQKQGSFHTKRSFLPDLITNSSLKKTKKSPVSSCDRNFHQVNAATFRSGPTDPTVYIQHRWLAPKKQVFLHISYFQGLKSSQPWI